MIRNKIFLQAKSFTFLFFRLLVYTLFDHTFMPGYDYRLLNAVVAKAPANRLKLLLESVKKRNLVSEKSK